MDLTSYVDRLGNEFVTLFETGGDEARAQVERVAASLDSAIRLALLEALSAAADEITLDLAPGSVELRLRGRDPNFVVTAPPQDQEIEGATHRAAEVTSDSAPPATDDSATARINFRLPEPLKVAIEEAAGAEGRSVNAWLVRVVSAALQPQAPADRTESRGKRGAQRYTGWVH